MSYILIMTLFIIPAESLKLGVVWWRQERQNEKKKEFLDHYALVFKQDQNKNWNLSLVTKIYKDEEVKIIIIIINIYLDSGLLLPWKRPNDNHCSFDRIHCSNNRCDYCYLISSKNYFFKIQYMVKTFFFPCWWLSTIYQRYGKNHDGNDTRRCRVNECLWTNNVFVQYKMLYSYNISGLLHLNTG